MFRVTQHQVSNTTIAQLAKHTSEMYRVQQRVSSGLRIEKPSDDPAGIRRSLVQKDRVSRLEAQEISLVHVESRINSAHVQLREAGNLLLRARSVALNAQQATDPSEISVLATELDGILSQMVSVANSSDESGYLFAGTASLTRPFPNLNSTGRNQYDGTSATTVLHMTGDIQRNALLPGDMVFQPNERGATRIVGTTGAQPGQGTDTAKGVQALLVNNTSTIYAGASGINSGTSASQIDSIVGPAGAHSLQIIDTSGTGAFGTISLDGGPAVAFSSSDTDLVINGPTGQQISVNTTSIVAGFNGSVSITANGTMSIDGGLTSTAIDFSANQVVTDSRDGTILNINSTQIRNAGEDQIEFPGTADAFAAIVNLKNDILNSRNLSASERAAAIDRRLGDIEVNRNHVLDVIGVQSVSLEQIDRLKTRTEDLKLTEKLELNETIAADISEAVVRLQEIQNLQEYTMASIARVLAPNLLNYLT
ncbi:MAG: hypothetical protein JNL58_09705 [Planctomyces sp.]|nr:hypothetical protein [Planctomyces sp.]